MGKKICMDNTLNTTLNGMTSSVTRDDGSLKNKNRVMAGKYEYYIKNKIGINNNTKEVKAR